MAVLPKRIIEELVESQKLTIDPFDTGLLSPASYDLRVSHKILASPLSPDELGEVIYLTDARPTYEIQSGQMVGVMSKERLVMPLDVSARFGIKSDFARRGIISFGGLQIDPGWRGHLIMNLLNVGPEPVGITKDEPLFSVEFSRLEEPTTEYPGRYQDQNDFPQDQVDYILSARTTSFAEIPHFRLQIAHLSTLIQGLLDHLPDPDRDMILKEDVEAFLHDSAQRPKNEFLSLREMRRSLGL